MNNEFKVLKPIIIESKENLYFYIQSPKGIILLDENEKKIVDYLNCANDLEALCNNLEQVGINKSRVYDLLIQMRFTNLITFDESYFSDCIKKNEVYVMGEFEIKPVSHFIQHNFQTTNTIFSNYSKNIKFHPVFLRERVFQNQEVVVFDQLDNIKNVVVLKNIDRNNSPTVITLIQSIDCESHLKDFMNKIEHFLYEHKVHKIRIPIYRDFINDKFLNFIKQNHFFCEAKLKNETMLGDLIYYSKFITLEDNDEKK